MAGTLTAVHAVLLASLAGLVAAGQVIARRHARRRLQLAAGFAAAVRRQLDDR